MAFTKATKYQSKLRLAIFGPSGAGKTITSLLIAHGMGKKIALLDSENKTASKYAGQVFGKTTLEFDTDDLGDKTVGEYISRMEAAGDAGYEVLIVDSSSHAWKELLLYVEQLAKTKYKGNTWSAWSEGNPLQNRFVDAIQNSKCHLIFTMRSKTEWETEKTENGKTRPVRVGLTPEQGKGIEYEFDMLMEMDVDNNATIIKDRTGKFQGKIITKPGADFGKSILDWLSDAPPPPPPPPIDPEKVKASAMVEKLRSLGNEVYVMMQGEFSRNVQDAFNFGEKCGWDEEIMFAELKRVAKERAELDNKKVGEEPKKAKVKKDA